jgi:hypothetical protein
MGVGGSDGSRKAVRKDEDRFLNPVNRFSSNRRGKERLRLYLKTSPSTRSTLLLRFSSSEH